MARETQPNPLKTAIIVLGALATAWATIELALKPWLDGARAAINKSDPTVDPDGDEESSSKAAGQKSVAEVADAAASHESVAEVAAAASAESS